MRRNVFSLALPFIFIWPISLYASEMEAPILPVSAMLIALDYERDSRAADLKYQGKTLAVHGVVRSTGSTPARGAFLRLLGTSTESGFVRAWVVGNYNGIASITRNDEVDLKCKSEGMLEGEITLSCDAPHPKIAKSPPEKLPPTYQQVCIADASLLQKIAFARDYGVNATSTTEAISQDLQREPAFSQSFRSSYTEKITYLYSHPWITPAMARDGYYNQCMATR